jgi:hypothetical protein
MAALALAISATGFIRLVYFVSIGYAFSITGMAVLAGALFAPQLGPWAWAHLALLALYGLRLGSFLVMRERNPSYQSELEEVQRRNRKLSLFARFGIWIGVALLYVCMFSPGLLRAHAQAQGRSDALPILTGIGLLVMVFGLVFEGLADFQKSRFKKTAPKRFCDRGLFRIVRRDRRLGREPDRRDLGVEPSAPGRSGHPRHDLHFSHHDGFDQTTREKAGRPLRQGSRIPGLREESAGALPLPPDLLPQEHQSLPGIRRKIAHFPVDPMSFS